MKTQEGNKLIATFMDRESYVHSDSERLFVKWGNHSFEEARYHTSWDWLMPVITKIEEIYETENSLSGFSISGHGAYFSAGGFLEEAAAYPTGPKPAFKSRIEAAWYVVINFIKWYNTEKLLFEDNESTVNRELACCSCGDETKTLAAMCTVCVHQLQEKLKE